MKLKNRKGNESTVRIIVNDDNTHFGILGNNKDLYENEILLDEPEDEKLNKWLLIYGMGEKVKEFNSKEEIKIYLNIK